MNLRHTLSKTKGLCSVAAITSTRQFSSSTVNALNICIIAGSTRTSGPPSPILSQRVASFVKSSLENRDTTHEISIIEARENLPLLERPHFSYATSQCPPELQEMHKTLSNADAYITITPEYNHSPCPGLMNIMNHFGSSTFGFKPSGIVSYSAGQWGGTRAANNLRPFLSELGCLPVSAMTHIPKAAEVLDENGNVINDDDLEQWNSYIDRMISQLEWWGDAAKIHKDKVDPLKKSPAFKSIPSQRNAPS